jgi:hypothetical protein
MIEKGRISALQMAIMMYPTIIATAVLIVPAITGKLAGRDLWLSPVLASSTGFITVYLAYRLNNLYPKMKLIEYSEIILSFLPGKVLGFMFLFFYLHLNGTVLRIHGEFVVGSFFTKTPLIVIIRKHDACLCLRCTWRSGSRRKGCRIFQSHSRCPFIVYHYSSYSGHGTEEYVPDNG